MKDIATILVFLIFFLSSCSKSHEKKEAINLSVLKVKDSNSLDFYHGDLQIMGERIDGPANMRDTINGKVLFVLNDNALVETSVLFGRWMTVGLFVKLDENEKNQVKILPNKFLISSDGKIIGKTVDTVEVYMEDNDLGLIEAYTSIQNIKEYTIPERALEYEINAGHLDKKRLDRFIKTFGFYIVNESDLGYQELFISESIMEDPSPRDRITLLFDKNDYLVGMIHSRQLNLSKHKTYKLIRGHSLTITKPMDNQEINRIIRTRIDYLNTVD